MFQTASRKLGLAYAVAGNAAGGGQQGETDEPLGTDAQGSKANGGKLAPSLNKKELENLLRHGAYDIFTENKAGAEEAESRDFCEADIDSILERSSVIVHDNKGSQAQGVVANFSKASFVSSTGQENTVAIDDPEFWAKVVGLTLGNEEEEITGRRRKCREMVGEGSYKEPGMRFAEVSDADHSDSESDTKEPKEKRSKKPDRVSAVVVADFNDTSAMTRLSNALASRGYGNWAHIRKDSRVKWSPSDIAKGCRLIIIQLLMDTYNLEAFDPSAPRKMTSRDSWSGVADRQSLSPGASADDADKPTVSECRPEDVASFMEHMSASKVCRLVFTAAGNDMVPSDVPHEDSIVEQSLSKSRLEGFVLSPLVAFNASPRFPELSDSYFSSACHGQSMVQGSFEDKAAKVIMTLKSFCPSKGLAVVAEEVDGAAGVSAKMKKKKGEMEERLLQLDEVFDLHMAAVVCTQTPQTADTQEVSATAGRMDSDPPVATAGAGSRSHGSLEEYLQEAFDAEDTVEQPLVSIRLSCPWWSTSYDALLVKAVQAIGWPTSRQRYAAIQSYMAHAIAPPSEEGVAEQSCDMQIDRACSGEQSAEERAQYMKAKAEAEAKAEVLVISKAFPEGFPFRDRADISRRLKELCKVFRSGIKSSSRKLAQLVLKSFAKLGRPRTLYEEMKEADAGRGYRLEYTLDWETIAKDMGVRVITAAWVGRVREMGARLVAHQEEAAVVQRAKGNAFTDPDSFLATTDISFKQLMDGMERCEMMHRVRAAVCIFSDELVASMIVGTQRIPYTGPVQVLT